MIFERDIAHSILDEFSGREILFLLGTRQTGKTTIAKILQGKWKGENSLSQTEIDFIQEKEDGLSLIEVKSGIFKNILRAMVEFELKYKKTLKIKNKLIINKSYFNYTKEVKFIPIFLI